MLSYLYPPTPSITTPFTPTTSSMASLQVPVQPPDSYPCLLPHLLTPNSASCHTFCLLPHLLPPTTPSASYHTSFLLPHLLPPTTSPASYHIPSRLITVPQQIDLRCFSRRTPDPSEHWHWLDNSLQALASLRRPADLITS